MAEIGRAGYGSNRLRSPDRSVLVVDGLQRQCSIHGYCFRQSGVGFQPEIQQDKRTQRVRQGYANLDLDEAERGWIQYDLETHERLDDERCVVVGRDSPESDAGRRNYYILVVRPTGMENEYRRVGAGRMRSDYVARKGVEALIV
ncbi:hypothetical protein HBH62_253500 [Parastagonospora nodorum]|nr:hypothetical protein HBH62_253500 [Parastagonospora nodorum]